MADPRKILKANAKGEFFVDSTCIDCDVCREIAPEVFGDSGGYSYVRSQPKNENERRKAVRALISCPVGAIGFAGDNSKSLILSVINDFPILIDDDVFYCGFNSEKSYGANSYFVKNPKGNLLVDSPRFTSHLVKKLESMGGIKYIFLTHRDDVADAERFAEYFNSTTIIHKYDLIGFKNADFIIEGEEPVQIEREFLVIPTPGHTKGHCVLLYKDKFLFTGDHLWWSEDENCLSAGKSVCWYSWEEQIKSVEKLVEFDFEWILPGHGRRVKLPKDKVKEELRKLVERMKKSC